ncbi:MAG TPA: D-2-hydroxyacid dehydrogenase [Patescibacteria group bacterium]|nr:D-2-hydroxyacid dehydrogenase [Patescibacteria group bacterium]
MSGKLKVLMTFHITPELVEKIRNVDPRVEIIYEPELLGEPRYMNDQHGGSVKRTPAQEKRWLELLGEAEIILGYISRPYASELPRLAPNLRWMQSPSAGIGQSVKRAGWTETDIMFTTASGVHSTPLAEFCLMAMLMFVKDYFHMAEEKEKKYWQRTCTWELRGKTLAVVGLGRVGREVARLARCVGMHVIGSKRTTEGVDPESVGVERLYSWTDLNPMLSVADFVVLICPHTSETEGLLGEEQIAAMKEGAVLINISRGVIVDERAMIRALESGHLGGAALDVFAMEPLPPESPFWEMPNVIISPHSASTADTENAKLTEIFCDNLSRYLSGRPLRNLLDKQLLY